MTSRDEMIDQAYEILRPFETLDGRSDAANQGLRPPNYAAAASIVDAGWRPPVSEDVVERAARTVQAAVEDRQFAFTTEFYDAGHGGDYPPTRYTWDDLADFEQDAWRDGARRLGDAGLLAATPVPGEVVDIPAQEFVSIPVPPDAETVERVAAAMAEAVYCDGTWLRLAAEKKADYRRYARAALRALGEATP